MIPVPEPATSTPLQSLLAFTRTLPEVVRAIAVAESDRERTQRDALAAFAVRVASAGLLYLAQVFLARWMGSYEYGIYVLVWTWVLILSGFSHLGLNMAMIRLVPVLNETGRLDELRGLLVVGRLFALALSSAVAILGMAGLWFFADVTASPFVLPAYLALVCVPMATLTDVQDGIGRGRAWIGLALLPPYVLRPLLVLVVMFAAMLAGFPMTAPTAAAAAIVATWSAALVQTLLVEQRLRREIPKGPRSVALGSWLRTALPLLVIGSCEIVLQNADVLIVSRYMTPTDVAIYFAAAKTMALVMFVHYAVGSAVANRYAALSARGDQEGLKSFVRDAVHWTFWPSLVGAVLILALGRPLLSLFGPQFTEGYPVMFVLVLGFLMRASMGPAEFLLNMLGEQVLCAAVLVITALLNVALNFALVPTYGLMGAAVATSVSLTAAAVMNYLVARRRLELQISIWSHLRS